MAPAKPGSDAAARMADCNWLAAAFNEVGTPANVATSAPLAPDITVTAGVAEVMVGNGASVPLMTADVWRADLASSSNSVAVGSAPAFSMMTSSSLPGRTMRRSVSDHYARARKAQRRMRRAHCLLQRHLGICQIRGNGGEDRGVRTGIANGDVHLR